MFKANDKRPRFCADMLVCCALLLSGCASSNITVTDSQQEARKASDGAQRTADEFRQAGAGDAARQAQDRANRYDTQASKKPDSWLEYVVDVLFTSWLASLPPALPPPR